MFGKITILTAGESHGKALVVIVDGFPAGLEVLPEKIDNELARRQVGYGRGKRMEIERDRVQIISGVRHGKTLGSPIALLIENRDYENWSQIMSVEPADSEEEKREARPRPGHADFAGMLKYGASSARDVLERSSARETAARVAAGALAKGFLGEFGIRICSHVLSIGKVTAQKPNDYSPEIVEAIDKDPVRCPDADASGKMIEEIDFAQGKGDTLGGTFAVAVLGAPPGLGSSFNFEKRLDARLAGALCSIPSVKAVEVGEAIEQSRLPGSKAQDEIRYESIRLIHRLTNMAGGIEGGMTNGEKIFLKAYVKPVPTLTRPLSTVDMESLESAVAFKERADVCVVPAAAVIGEAMVSLVIADAFLDKFAGDTIRDVRVSYKAYLERISRFWKPPRPFVLKPFDGDS